MTARISSAALAAHPLAPTSQIDFSFKVSGGSVELSPPLEAHIREEFRILNAAYPRIPFDDVPWSEFMTYPTNPPRLLAGPRS